MTAWFHDQERGGEILEVTFSYQWQRGAWNKLPAAPFSIKTCCLLLVNPSWEKKWKQTNTQRVKQNKELIVGWTLFLSSLGRAQDLLEANAIALHLPNSPKPAYTGAGPGSLISWQLPFLLLLKPLRISYWACLTGQAPLLWIALQRGCIHFAPMINIIIHEYESFPVLGPNYFLVEAVVAKIYCFPVN